MPLIGFLSSASPGPYQPFLSAYHGRLKEGGYIEGPNVAMEGRWARGGDARLPTMAEDLRRVRVSLIGPAGAPASLAAQAAGRSMPIAFVLVDDPAKLGRVNSLSRPGGNATGVSFFIAELGSK